MSFLAKLNLGGTIDYNILTVDYDVTQMLDHNNRPNGAPKGGIINVRIESRSNTEILEWMIKPNMLKNGSIIFSKRDASSPMRKVDFKDAFCVYLKEQFNAEGSTPMITNIMISARELIISNLVISNAWPGMKSNSTGSTSQNNTITSFHAT